MAKRISYKLPDGFQKGNLGTCVYACYLIAEHNIKRGFTDFKVIKGRMQFMQANGTFHNGYHCFILKNNGEIYDPTYDQFFNYPLKESPVSAFNYHWVSIINEYTPQEFVDDYADDYLTDEYKAWCFKKTKPGEYFKGAVYKSEKDNPELIPKKCRA